jgi:hypothetical protein
MSSAIDENRRRRPVAVCWLRRFGYAGANQSGSYELCGIASQKLLFMPASKIGPYRGIQ